MDESGTYEGIKYRVIRRDIKHARIDMRSGELLLIMPEGMKVEELFQRNGSRIVKRFRELERIREEAKRGIKKGEIVLVGRRFTLKYRCEDPWMGGASVERIRRVLTVCPAREKEIKKLLREYLRENIERIVAKYSEKTGLEPEKIYIREQITKWGSCSSHRNLSFNLRLVFLPRPFLEYIVAHEIVHLRHMNHGERFKKELREVYEGRIPDRETMMKYWFRAEFMMSLLHPAELKKKIEDMKNDSLLADTVKERLQSFKNTGKSPTETWFSELCFCILTANTSADMGMRIQREIAPEEFMTLSEGELIERLHGLRARFYRMRGHYIHESQRLAPVLKEKVLELAGPPEKSTYGSEKRARKWLVENVKGFGYKEASHFLRNVGYENLAILDKHILRIMKEYGLIDEIPAMTPKRYTEIEEKLRGFGKEVNLSMAELDLYLWYMATGTVKK